MSRPAASLALAIVIVSTCVAPLGAQAAAPTNAMPAYEALRSGVRWTDVGQTASQVTATTQPRSAATDVDVIIRRRGQFMGVGAVTGMAAATVWAYRSANVNDGGLGVPIILPIIWIPSGLAGAAVGYGVSFLFYPPERRTHSML